MSVDNHQITAYLESRHTDPFGFMGMHVDPETGYLQVYTYQPYANDVRLVSSSNNRTVARMKHVRDGIFVASTRRKKPFKYHYKVTYGSYEVQVEDTYRFDPVLGELDLYLLTKGEHNLYYQVMGAHTRDMDGVPGASFVLWAPNASRVAVVGDFNDWDNRRHVMRKHHEAGYWDIFIPGVTEGANYKFDVRDANGKSLPLKADPVGSQAEHRPNTASKVVAHRHYPWADDEWMSGRGSRCELDKPISIYELHLGSWRRGEHGRFLNYREISRELIPYVKSLGFTHVQFLPVSEYPFDGSWGYQPVGLFAPTSRHGNTEDFKALIEDLHQADIGVLLDWVPGHFPSDDHGLANFDGTSLYEYADPKEGFHPDWNTYIYNYASPQVRNFLRASALHWIDRYHVDGIRVDAVASMLYRNYSRNEGEWIPNIHGGHENLEAIEFLQQFNQELYGVHPGVCSVAEESTAWPGVSKPTHEGGLGFGFKWNMGWMNDTLEYMSKDPIYRKHHHNEITFSLAYAFSEQFILPLSHDEVVHGKGSILGRMPGDTWQQFANLRAYYGFMWTHPGKKLLFMGSEFGQGKEWNHDTELDWGLLDVDWHQGVMQLIKDLNRVYCDYGAMHQLDTEESGFQWIDGGNADQSILAFCRYGNDRSKPLLIVCNFTPTSHEHFTLGVPVAGCWREIINTDSGQYQGSNMLNEVLVSTNQSSHGQEQSISMRIPPLATVILELS